MAEIIKTALEIIEGVKKWLSHYTNSILNRILKVYLGKLFCPIYVGIGDDSYTDHNKIVVSISEEEALTLTKGELARILILKGYHEAGHVIYTSRKEYEEGAYKIAGFFIEEAKKLGLKPNFDGVLELAAGLMNSLEDGRMENQVVKDVPGVQKHREWYRLREWLKYDPEKKRDDLTECLNNILDIATMGMYCKGFEANYPIGTNLRDIVDSCIEPITGYIKSSTVAKGIPSALIIADNIKELVFEAMKNEKGKSGSGEGPEVIDLPEELKDLLRDMLKQQRNFSNGETKETEQDGPVVAILTDDMEPPKNDEQSEGKKPDKIIDLRKNPPKARPQQRRLTESENEDEGEGQGDSSESSQSQGSNQKKSSEKSSSKESDEAEDESEGEPGEESTEESEKTSEGNSSLKNSKESEETEEKSENGKSTSKFDSEESEEESKGEGSGSDESEETEDSSESEGSEESEDEDEGGFESESEGSGESEDESKEENGKGSEKDSSNESKEGSDHDDTSEGGENDYTNDTKPKSDDAESKASGEDTLKQLQQAAKAFEEALEKRLNSVTEETLPEVQTKVSKADRDMEAAELIEMGNTKLDNEDVKFLHDNGYLSNYYNRVPARRLLDGYGGRGIKPEPKVVSRGRYIENQIRNIINSQSDPDREGMYDGDLDEDSLGRFVTFGDSDIFCQEGEPKEPNMCVYVRQDNSGSMSRDNKYQLACEAGAIIEQAFKNLVPLKMTTFTDCSFDIIKDWMDVDTNRSYMSEVARYYHPTGRNDDALAIMSAARELMHRTEEHKVLIMISDGLPCCSAEHVRQAVDYARKNGIFVMSFFIGKKEDIEGLTEAFRAMYVKYFCGVSPDKLGDVLVKFLRALIEG